MTVAGSSAIPWRPPEAALYLGVIELCTSRLLFQSHDTLPPIILVAEPLMSIFDYKKNIKYNGFRYSQYSSLTMCSFHPLG